MEYSALDIARYIICIANRNGDIITNLKLQKLLYYAQAWFLVNSNGKRLFVDNIEAWQYGPVIPPVYSEFSHFGRSPIEIDCDMDTDFSHFTNEVIEYLNEFCEEFLRFSATELVGMTHNERPWLEASAKGLHSVIDVNSMFKYYTEMLQNG